MKSECVWGDRKRLGDLTSRHPAGTSLDQQPENIETVILCETRQGGDGVTSFHISTNIELFGESQRVFRLPYLIFGVVLVISTLRKSPRLRAARLPTVT